MVMSHESYEVCGILEPRRQARPGTFQTIIKLSRLHAKGDTEINSDLYQSHKNDFQDLLISLQTVEIGYGKDQGLCQAWPSP